MPPKPNPEEEVRASIMAGLVVAVAERGYAATTINDIVNQAHVSKSTFYAHFKGKDDCYLAAYELASDAVLGLIVEAAARDLPEEERVLAATRAYLDRAAEDRATTRTFILEVLAAGPDALAMRHAVNRRFAEVLRELVDEYRGENFRTLTESAALLIVGGANELVLSAIVEDRLDELPDLAVTVADALLAAVTER
ncbi:MAG: TetR/AcrR family transcriptional regulator [Solirubrobacterales bacterium]|nr:TetR/AcrR family transcriptional regulator [Solirubrobacterales bacterium]